MEVNGIILRQLACLTLALTLSGCDVLPGMRGIDVNNIPKQDVPQTVTIQSTIIPINASMLAHQPPPDYIYRVAPQDVLSIVVWQHPEFNPPVQITSTVGSQSTQAAGQPGYLVDHTGRIYFPLIGNVQVAGKTINQIHDEITAKLKTYVRNPQVIVRVADFRGKKVYVLGEVMKPNLLPLNDQPLTLNDALSMTGNFNPDTADTVHIYVIRGNFARPKIYWLQAHTPEALLLAENFQLQPDDIVYVSTAPVARWNRFLNQLLPTIQTYWYTRSIINYGH